MPIYRYSGDDGTYTFRNEESLNKPVHGITFKGHTEPSAGTVGIKVRQPGAPEDLLISVGSYDFTDLSVIEFVGNVAEWHFEVSGVDTDLIETTIVSTTTAKGESGGGITPEDQAKLDAITSTGSGSIITNAERSTISSITDTGSGQIITAAEREKLGYIYDTGSGNIIIDAERTKLDGLTDTGSGAIITDDERDKLNSISDTPEEDELLEAFISKNLIVKNLTVGQ